MHFMLRGNIVTRVCTLTLCTSRSHRANLKLAYIQHGKKPVMRERTGYVACVHIHMCVAYLRYVHGLLDHAPSYSIL